MGSVVYATFPRGQKKRRHEKNAKILILSDWLDEPDDSRPT